MLYGFSYCPILWRHFLSSQTPLAVSRWQKTSPDRGHLWKVPALWVKSGLWMASYRGGRTHMIYLWEPCLSTASLKQFPSISSQSAGSGACSIQWQITSSLSLRSDSQHLPNPMKKENSACAMVSWKSESESVWSRLYMISSWVKCFRY